MTNWRGGSKLVWKRKWLYDRFGNSWMFHKLARRFSYCEVVYENGERVKVWP